MKKILILSMLAGSFLFADIFDDLKQKEVETFRYLDKDYPIDKTCTRLDLKKFLTLEDNLVKEKKNRKFFLDLCEPFKELYHLNKSVYDRTSSIKSIEKRYASLVAAYRDSFYINFYSFIFFKDNHIKSKTLNFDLFKFRTDDLSEDVKLFLNRRTLSVKVNKKEDYLLNVNRLGRPLLKSKFNEVYLDVSNDLTKFSLKYDKKNYEKFLRWRIDENKKRGLNNKYLYMELANYLFEKTYLNKDFDEDIIKDLVLKSYEEGELKSQTKLYLKLKIRKEYFELKNTYPPYIKNIEEYDLIMKNLEKTKKYQKIVNKKYFYLAQMNAFLYEKLIYLKNKEVYRNELIRNLNFVLEKETNPKEIRTIKSKIDGLRDGTFFDLKI